MNELHASHIAMNCAANQVPLMNQKTEYSREEMNHGIGSVTSPHPSLIFFVQV